MKSTFQTIKKRILPQTGDSGSKTDHAKRKIEHPHFKDEEHPPSHQISASTDDLEFTPSAPLNDGIEASLAKKNHGIPWRKRPGRKKAYEAKGVGNETKNYQKEIGSPDGHNKHGDNTKRQEKRFGFFRRSVYAMRFSAIDDPDGSPASRKSRLSRPKSVDGLNTSPSLSVFSLVRRSIRRSRQSEGNTPVVSVETSPREVTASPSKSSSSASQILEYSSADISSTKSSVKDSEETEGTKTMSIDSDVNRSVQDLKTKSTSKDADIDFDMNDLPVSVPRLSNKAAYDKIALRPKRRPARNARGVQQQHVVRVEPQVNGFEEVDSSRDEEQREEASRDVSPPRAKKPRTPIHMPVPSQQDSGSGISGEDVSTSTTPKRYSRSPMGPGPGMIVPTLQDVQNFKLRKAQSGEKGKEPEKAPEQPKSGKTKSTPNKVEKSKPPKKAGKKSSKQEQKLSAEGGGSSIFPWKNKTSSPKPTRKSPVPSPKTTEGSKENEKPKSFFTGFKTGKKSGQEKDAKAKISSSSENKETAKKEGLHLGKRDKNHSGNNSKTDVKIAPENAMDVVEQTAVVTPSSPKTPKQKEVTMEVDVKREDRKDKTLLDEINAELFKKPPQKGIDEKSEGGESKFSGERMPESKPIKNEDKEKSEHPRKIVAEKSSNISSDSKHSEAEKATRSELNDSSKSHTTEKPKPFTSKKPSDLKVDISQSSSVQSAQGRITSPKSSSPSVDVSSTSAVVEKPKPRSPQKTEDALPAQGRSTSPKSSSPAVDVSCTSPSVVEKPKPFQRAEDQSPDASKVASYAAVKEAAESSQKAISHGADTASSPVVVKPTPVSSQQTDDLNAGNAKSTRNIPPEPALKISPKSPLSSDLHFTSPPGVVKPKPFSFRKAGELSADFSKSDSNVPPKDVPKTSPEPISPSSNIKLGRLASAEKGSKSSTSAENSKPFSFRKAADWSIDMSQAGDITPPEKSSKISPKSPSPPFDIQVNQSVSSKDFHSPPAAEKPKPFKFRKAGDVSFSTTASDQVIDASPETEPKAETAKTVTSPTVPKAATHLKHVDIREKKEDNTKNTPTSQARGNSTELKQSGKESGVASMSRRAGNLAPVKPDGDTKKANVRPSSAREDKPQNDVRKQKDEGDDKNTSSLKDDDEVKETKQERRERRVRSSSARDADSESPMEIFSRAKLKHVGDHVSNRKTSSMKISPTTSPTKSLRTRSFHDKSSSKNTEISIPKSAHPETPKETSSKDSSPTKPSPNKEKPKVAEKPKSPIKASSNNPKIKKLLQDAENNNVKPSTAQEEIKKKETPVSEQTAPSRRTASTTAKEDNNAKDGMPAWVQMARRRSKVWEDGAYRPKMAAQRTPTATEPSKNETRPKTLPVATKPRSDSSSKTPKSDTTPIKSSPHTPSEKAQSNRTAPIPNISMISPRKPTPPPKEVTSTGQPSWLAIAMQKQKSWAKEETV